METENLKNKSLFKPAFILGLLIAIGLIVHGYFMANRIDNNKITVTGSTKKMVESDLAKWSASFTRRAEPNNLKEVMAQSEKDKTQLLKFISDLGIDPKGVTFLPVQTSAIYQSQRPDAPEQSQTIVGYNVIQEVRVESRDLDKMDKLGAETKKIVELGIIPDYQRTEYFYTKLAELRPELYSLATADARQRAEAVIRDTGASLGGVVSASTGVIQVMAPNTADVSDWGMYDLSTRQKEIMATVYITFKMNKN